jgi:excisionase family DNA binding protein
MFACKLRSRQERLMPRRAASGLAKRPQRSTALKLSRGPDEKLSMSVSTPPLPRSARQLGFTSSQAATYLGVSLATIRRWTDAGHIDCYRTPGGQRRFSREQLDGFVVSMQQDGPEPEPEPVVEIVAASVRPAA